MRHPHGEKHYASSSESDSPLEQQRDEEAGSGALKGWEWKDAPYGNAGTTAVRSVPHFGGQTLSRLHHTRLQTASANHGTEPNVPLSHVPESPGSRRSQSMPSTPVLQSHSEWVRLLLRLYHNLTPKLLLALVLASLPVMLLVAFALRMVIHSRLAAAQQHILDIPTCTARLHALGLDLGDGLSNGDLRLSVSRYALDRRRIYDGMASGIIKQGLSVGGVITQGLKQDDLFKVFKDARSGQVRISPILHHLQVPVRAMILPLLDPLASNRIVAALRSALLPILPKGSVWRQDDKLYHATLYHASSHAAPVAAPAEKVAWEYAAIKGVTTATCPIRAVLDRIIVTASGVVVACWQVLPEGGEPALLRAALSKALPDAPPKDAQMVKEPAMLHTTLARLLQPRLPDAGSSSSSGSGSSRTSGGNSGDSSSYAARSGRELREATRGGGSSGTHARRMEAAAGLSGVGGAGEKAEVDGGSTLPHINGTAVVEVVTQLSHSLCGLTTTFHQVWFIEEQDLLALALTGKYVKHVAPLSCPAGGVLAQAGLQALTQNDGASIASSHH